MRYSFSGVLFGLSLAACIGGGDDSGKMTIIGKMEVLSIDRQAHTITTTSTVTECQEDGTSYTVSDTSVEHYAVKDGKLILWDEEDCTASALTGSSADIVGTWKGTGVEMESAIPAEYRPSTCPATLEPDSSEGHMFTDIAVTYVISEHSIEFTGTGAVCPAEGMAAEFTGSDFFTIVSKTCNDVVLKDPAGKQMVVHASMGQNRMSVTINYKGASCGFASDMPMPGHPIDCAKQAAAMQSYMQCMEGMGGLAGAKATAVLRKAAAKLF